MNTTKHTLDLIRTVWSVLLPRIVGCGVVLLLEGNDVHHPNASKHDHVSTASG
jgi:hypothetical protein